MLHTIQAELYQLVRSKPFFSFSSALLVNATLIFISLHLLIQKK